MIWELAEFFVAFNNFFALTGTFFAVATEKHPEILNDRACAEIIEIDQKELAAVMKKIAFVAVTVNADEFTRIQDVIQAMQNGLSRVVIAIAHFGGYPILQEV